MDPELTDIKKPDCILKDIYLSFYVETKSKSVFLVFNHRNSDLFQVCPTVKFRIIRQDRVIPDRDIFEMLKISRERILILLFSI